jgi:hypothetical protein
MDLSHILNRIAEGLVYVDKNAEIYNKGRMKATYAGKKVNESESHGCILGFSSDKS